MGGEGFEPPISGSEGLLVRNHQRVSYDLPATIKAFRDVCRVDLRLAPATTRGHVRQIERFLSWARKAPRAITRDDIRAYLVKFKDGNPNIYANVLKSLRVFFRNYLGMESIIQGFRFPKRPIRVKLMPTKEEVHKFFATLESPRDKALFLMYATTGLRGNEVVSLKMEDLDLQKRMVIPKSRGSRTKHTWVTFYNEETERSLKEYQASRNDSDSRLFPMERRTAVKIFQRASKRSGIHITP